MKFIYEYPIFYNLIIWYLTQTFFPKVRKLYLSYTYNNDTSTGAQSEADSCCGYVAAAAAVAV